MKLELINYKKIKKSIKIPFFLVSIMQLTGFVMLILRNPLGLEKIIDVMSWCIIMGILVVIWSFLYALVLIENKKNK